MFFEKLAENFAKAGQTDSIFNSKPKNAIEKGPKDSSRAVSWNPKATIVNRLDLNNSYSTGEQSYLRDLLGNKS